MDKLVLPAEADRSGENNAVAKKTTRRGQRIPVDSDVLDSSATMEFKYIALGPLRTVYRSTAAVAQNVIQCIPETR